MVRPEGASGSRSEAKKYLMPTHAHVMVHDAEEVHAGDVLAKIPRETTKTKDITGGLPRVVELFEARKPRETAIIAEMALGHFAVFHRAVEVPLSELFG